MVAKNHLDISDSKSMLDISLKSFSCMFSDIEHHYKNLLYTLPDIVYTLDEKGHFTFVSDSIDKLGFSRDELLGRHFSFIIHPTDIHSVSRDDVLPKFKGIVTGSDKAPKLFDERRSFPRKTDSLPVRILSKNALQGGTNAPFYSCMINAAGQYATFENKKEKQFYGTIGTIFNIHRADCENHTSHEKNNEPKDLLVRSIAHAFSNVLTAIYGNIQLIEMEIGEKSEIAQNIEAIKDGVKKSVSLVQRLSSAIKTSTPLNSSSNLSSILYETANEIFEESDFNPIYSISPSLIEPMLDPDYVRQIVRAILYHVKFTANLQNPILIEIENLAKDSCHQMPRQDCKYVQIYCEFINSNNELTNDLDVFGSPDKMIALTYSYSILKRFGGKIHINSDDPEKTVITAYLPAITINSKIADQNGYQMFSQPNFGS